MRQASAMTASSFNSRTDAPAFAAAAEAIRSASLPSFSGVPANSCVTTPIFGALSGLASNSGRLVMAASPRATSSTPAANRPTVSSVQEKHLTPTVGSIRYDGLIAATPQNDAGRISEPPVCVPKASGTRPAPTAAADPDEDPPGVCAGWCGLRVSAGSIEAKAVVTVLPAIVAPRRFNSATIDASALGR